MDNSCSWRTLTFSKRPHTYHTNPMGSASPITASEHSHHAAWPSHRPQRLQQPLAGNLSKQQQARPAIADQQRCVRGTQALALGL
jgi:hypothetical protein